VVAALRFRKVRSRSGAQLGHRMLPEASAVATSTRATTVKTPPSGGVPLGLVWLDMSFVV
jgi:hypothetical protein